LAEEEEEEERKKAHLDFFLLSLFSLATFLLLLNQNQEE
jgi:hypothetical protein